MRLSMPEIQYYEDENIIPPNKKDTLEKRYSSLSGDIHYMLHMMKIFNKEVTALLCEMKDLKEDIDENKINTEYYDVCKKSYIDLYHKFDDIRNYYDGSKS